MHVITIQSEIALFLQQYPELAEDEILRADMIEAETLAFDFLSEMVRKISEGQIITDGTAERIKELSERKSRIERRIEALRALAFKVMQSADIRKAELPCATLSIRNGTPKVVITDEAVLPADCVKTSITPDKTAIREKLTAGQSVPGAELSNGEPTLAVRIK